MHIAAKHFDNQNLTLKFKFIFESLYQIQNSVEKFKIYIEASCGQVSHSSRTR